MFSLQAYANTLYLHSISTKLSSLSFVQEILIAPLSNTSYLRTERSLVSWVSCGGTCPPGLSLRLDTSARIFLDLFQDLTALFFQW